MNSARLYWRYISYSLRSQLQYRASFIMHVLGNLFVSATEFLGIWALFARFGTIRGWTLPEVALLYAISDLAFAIAESVPRAFDIFPSYVKSGDFDRILLRPRSPAFQVLAKELQLMRFGRFAQGTVILLWAMSSLDGGFSLSRIALALFAIIGGAALFSGLFILGATLSFWTTESLEVVNIATYGGNYATQYPMSIYRPWLRHAMTFVLPLATVSYLPAHAILHRADSVIGSSLWIQCAAPAVGMLFLLLSLQVWRIGVRHYQSTGS
jgi:ABC-2 type transport system permease protein